MSPYRVRAKGAVCLSMNCKAYSSDLTDEQWTPLELLLPSAKPGGRPRSVDLCEIVNAMLYLDPSALILNSQSVKTTEKEGAVRCWQESFGTQAPPWRRYRGIDSCRPRAAGQCAGPGGGGAITPPPDRPDASTGAVVGGRGHAGQLVDWVRQEAAWELEVVAKPPTATTFVVLPKRWIVEPTFAWLGKCRQLNKDYEHTIASSEALIRLATIGLMLRRLQPAS